MSDNDEIQYKTLDVEFKLKKLDESNTIKEDWNFYKDDLKKVIDFLEDKHKDLFCRVSVDCASYPMVEVIEHFNLEDKVNDARTYTELAIIYRDNVEDINKENIFRIKEGHFKRLDGTTAIGWCIFGFLFFDGVIDDFHDYDTIESGYIDFDKCIFKGTISNRRHCRLSGNLNLDEPRLSGSDLFDLYRKYNDRLRKYEKWDDEPPYTGPDIPFML